MNADDRITIAKQAAIKCLNFLSENDYVSVISFGSETKVIQSQTSAMMTKQVASGINRISANGGTKMSPALHEAYKQLDSLEAENKHVIVMTDGEPESSDKTSCIRWINHLAENNIGFSIINILNGSSTAISYLKGLASKGNGCFHYMRRVFSLNDVMSDCMENDILRKIIKQTCSVEINSQYDASVEDILSFKEIDCLYRFKAKASSNIILTVEYAKEAQDKKDDGGNAIIEYETIPLYAWMESGKGRVGSFAGSLTDVSTGKFQKSENGKKFFKQANMALIKKSAPYLPF